jgi:hypothetical protein
MKKARNGTCANRKCEYRSKNCPVFLKNTSGYVFNFLYAHPNDNNVPYSFIRSSDLMFCIFIASSNIFKATEN